MDGKGIQFLHFGNTQLENNASTKLEKIDKKLVTQNWKIHFLFSNEDAYFNAFIVLIPTILIILVLEGLLILIYINREKIGENNRNILRKKRN